MRSVKVEESSSHADLLACRICLATDTKLYNIYDYGFETSFSELLGTKVSPTDGFPQHVCGCCAALVAKARALRRRCLRSEELLKQALMHQHFITTSFINNIDRITNQLTLRLTAHTNISLIECTHNEPPIKHEENEELCFKYEDDEDNILDDDEDDLQEIKKLDEDDLQEIKKLDGDDLQEIKKLDDDGFKQIKKLDEDDFKQTRKLRSSKRKKKSVSDDLAKKTKKIRKMFDCEEDFPKFESKYNMEIVVLTMEQQLENMVSRKNSSNYLNSPFRCELCFKGFSSEATFKNHTVKHHDASVGAQKCELCHCRFRIPAFLRTHAETHRLKFVCKECRFVASNRYHAITHFREHSGFKYICKYCGASFKKPSTHGTHVRIQHPTENTSCDVCGETFQGEFGLRMHKTRAHKQGGEGESESLSCSTCGAHFASAYAAARHTFTALDHLCNPDMRACTLCGENLATEELLLAHARERHSTPETRCHECDKTFLTEASRSVHYERVHLQVKNVRKKAAHHARRQYGGVVMCELCGKRCKNSTILKYHQRTHTGEKPHSCPRCPKRFVSPMLLHCHLRSHTGEKPYKCTQCHKSFAQKSALTVHKTVHTGEKPFACSICSKTFTQAASVHTHIKYVHMKVPAPPRRRNLKRE